MNRLKKYSVDWLPADYVIALLLVVFPVYNKLMPMLMVLLGLTLFLKRNSPGKMLSSLSLKLPFIWFFIFYLIHVVGLLYTENMAYAWGDLGMKASFVAMPLILIWVRTNISLTKIIDLYLVGLVVAIVVFIGYAIFKSIYNPENNHWAYFTESYFSFSMHRSYFATYVAIGAIISLFRLFKERRIIYLSLLVLFSMTVVLTFSKAGILLLVLVGLPSMIVLSFKQYGWLRTMVFALIAGVLIIMTLMSSNSLQVRFQKMIHATSAVSTSNNTTVESSASRVIMWSTSIMLIKENWLYGVGTGDVSDALDNRNKRLGNTGVAQSSLNSHNQYLNTSVQLGLMGLVPLMMIFITSFFTSLFSRSFETIVLVLILFLTLMFESFLETQAGIIPVAFLLSLFALKLNYLRSDNYQFK